MFKKTDRAERTVGHHEKHTDDLRHEIDASRGDEYEHDDRGRQCGVPRFIRYAASGFEERIDCTAWENIIVRQRLECPRGDKNGSDC